MLERRGVDFFFFFLLEQIFLNKLRKALKLFFHHFPTSVLPASHVKYCKRRALVVIWITLK